MDRITVPLEFVVTDPEVLGGMPVIRGTRIPVYDVAASVAAGVPVARILAAYPALDAEQIELATLYVEANPPRARPSGADALPEGSVTLSDSRVPRRARAG